MRALRIATALLVFSTPAMASATQYFLTFTNGFAAVTPAPVTTTGEFTDTFLFTTTGDHTVSGSLTTQRLRSQPNGGTILSDLDFLSVDIDGNLIFTLPPGGTDAVETSNLATAALAAGDHVLTVHYRADTASIRNGAGYGGVVNLGELSVPEPATWAMLTVGFGLVGASARRRRARGAIALA